MIIKPKLIFALLIAATISSCKKSETLNSLKPANASQKTLDNTPGCGIDTGGEGIRYITGAHGIVSGNAILDGSGNILTTSHSFSIDFGPATGTWWDTYGAVYTNKVSPSGKTVWQRNLFSYDGGIGIGPNDFTYYTLPATTTDASGNFFQMHLVVNEAASAWYNDAYISKYNSAGTLLWSVEQPLGYGPRAVADIKTDALGNLFLCGTYSAYSVSSTTSPQPLDFDPSSATQYLSGSGSFIQKLDANGNLASLTQVNYRLQYFALGANMDIYDTGTNPDGTGYIRKISNTGALVWQFNLGGATPNNITIDTKGNSIVWGWFPNLIPSGIAKFDAAGHIKWYHYNLPPIQAVVTDALGNIYTTGAFSGTVDFDPSPATYNLTSAGQSAIFIEKFSPTGQLLWVKQRPVLTATRVSATSDAKFIYLQGNTGTNTLFFAKVSLCN